MVEIYVELPALLRFMERQGYGIPREGDEIGHGIHAWLKAAFGELSPRPWRLLADGIRPTRILGYSLHTAEELLTHLQEFGDPSTAAVCPEPAESIAGKPMPIWGAGRRLGFEVLLCPVGRKSRSGLEKDVFLLKADAAGDETLDRQSVYCDWLRERLEMRGGADLDHVHMAGFRLARHVRLKQRSPDAPRRQQRRLTRPHVLFRGRLTVESPAAFNELLAKGVGRHKAYGYGMILLRPAS